MFPSNLVGKPERARLPLALSGVCVCMCVYAQQPTEKALQAMHICAILTGTTLKKCYCLKVNLVF